MGIFDQFQSPAPVDVAGTPFQDQPSAVLSRKETAATVTLSKTSLLT